MFKMGVYAQVDRSSTRTGRDRFSRPSGTKFRKHINAHRPSRPNSPSPPPTLPPAGPRGRSFSSVDLAGRGLLVPPPPDAFGCSVDSLSHVLSTVGLDATVRTPRRLKEDRRRHYTRYDYTALEDEQSLQEKMEMERKVLRSQARETAFLTCQYYLKNSGRYVLLEQLGDIGSRLDKFWFLVRDASTKTERLLTMIPQTVNSPINFSATTKKVLAELFLALQHPYIYPVLDVDVKMLAEEEYVMVILPYNAKGSLKDIIYKARCQEDWQDKYHHRSNGLPIGQVQRLGRHILEALLFLQERGFPTFGHLHSGNIIVQNGVSRLTGFENTLLGYTSRIYSLIKRKVKDDREAIDVICFGHVLFEMCAGYELSTPHPTSRHIEELQQVPQYSQIVEVLNFIFDQEDGHYPTIEQVSLIDFFRNMDLREMRSMPVPPVFQSQLSPAVCNLLKDVSRHQKTRSMRPMFTRREVGMSEDERVMVADRVEIICDDYDGNDDDEDDIDDGDFRDNGCADDVDSSHSSFLRTLCSKRARSSSLFENAHRERTTPSPCENKCRSDHT